MLSKSYITDVVGAFLTERLSSLATGERKALASSLFTWLATKARKKPLPYLDEKLSKMQTRIEAMVNQLEFQYENNQLDFRLVGDHEQTFKMLDRGTDWFDGHPNLENFIYEQLFQ